MWGILILVVAMVLGTIFVVALGLGAFSMIYNANVLSAGRPPTLSSDIRKKSTPVQYMSSSAKVNSPETPTARRSVVVGRDISDFGYPDVVAPTMVRPVEPVKHAKQKKGKIPLLVGAAVASTILYMVTH